ncbi:MAG: GFA family protein [Alphaproteobacteria bacterium]|nr:GFA family protein [Alphaproteobacteria bacterium]
MAGELPAVGKFRFHCQTGPAYTRALIENETLGGCQCGAVRYRIGETAVSASNCHCSMCQRSVGAVYVSWMTFPEKSFEITKGKIKKFKSSAKAERGFCGACGCSITFRHDDDEGLIDVTTATADDPAIWPPTHHIWTSTRRPWVTADDGLPSYEGRKPRE